MTEIKAPEVKARTSEEIEDVYRLHFNLLRYLACQKFRIPPADAENLIHEVFVGYLSAQSSIRDVRSWLVGAICNASRMYWRNVNRTESLPDYYERSAEPAEETLFDDVAQRITVRETMSRLHQKCRDTLRLRYLEGFSANELARELETTNRYAEKLIHKCLKRAHKIYLQLTSTRNSDDASH